MVVERDAGKRDRGGRGREERERSELEERVGAATGSSRGARAASGAWAGAVEGRCREAKGVGARASIDGRGDSARGRTKGGAWSRRG